LNADPRELRQRSGASIATVAILVTSGLAILLLGAGGFVGYHLLRAEEERELAALTEALADQASTGLALPLWNFDESQIRKATESVLRARPVASVEVLLPGPDHPLLVLSRGIAGDTALVPTRMPRQGLLSAQRGIRFSGEEVGKVTVLVSPEWMQTKLRRIRWVFLGMGAILAVAISGALYLLLWRLAIRPVRMLERFALQVEGHGLDVSPLAQERFWGELDSLRLSISRMVELLNIRYLALQAETARSEDGRLRFRTLVDTIPDLIWLKDAQGVYLSCNRMFERFFGATEAEIVGKTDYDFVPKELADHFRDCDRRAIAHGRPTQNEELIRFADDGHEVLLEATKTPMTDSDGKLVGVLGVGRDITERRAAEIERRRIDEALGNSRKLEALGVLSAGIAHNINNVLAVVLGAASSRETESVDPADRETFALISSTCRKGRDVVRSLTQFSKPTLTRKADFELHPMLREIRTLVGTTSRNLVEFKEDFAPLEVWIHGDEGSLSNSFLNLCLNSSHAMPGGGTLTLRTSIEPGDRVRIEVEDDGVGMEPQVLARALEPFFTTKEVGKGTGLGLSMTHGVVRAHGGELLLRSTPGEGTVATILLPVVPKPVAPEPAVPASVAPLRILVVDDDPDLRFLMARMLRIAGHFVETAGSGHEALESIARGDVPDLVVMDQNMPGMDGVRTLAEIRKIRPDLFVLISSGQLDLHEWDVFRQPRTGVLPKPFDLAELAAKISELHS
jgi:PAS domain S-box-containing protein